MLVRVQHRLLNFFLNMTLKESVQLGDVLVLNDGRTYIYLNCPGTGYSSTGNILARPQSYFGSGLESFDDSLCNRNRLSVRIVDIRKPIVKPLTFLNYWEDIQYFDFEGYVKKSITRDSEENFINISLYV